MLIHINKNTRLRKDNKDFVNERIIKTEVKPMFMILLIACNN